MLNLYYSPGACSLASHIVAREAGLDFEIEKVDGRTKTTSGGASYYDVTAKGYVPALRLDSGEVLTEGTAIMPYLADRAPASGLMPPAGTLERYRVQEWLGYINSELHKAFSPLFGPTTPAEYKATSKAAIAKRFEWVQSQLEGRQFLVGERFTVADAYLFTILGWTRYVSMDLGDWPGLAAYADRIAARPAVLASMKAEGLLK
jgi:glutathione S-transferase